MSDTVKVKVTDVVVKQRSERDPLPDDLPRKVYGQPVILRGDMVLVDGLRRLRRAEAQGQKEILAIITSSYPVLMEAIKTQNGDVDNEVPPRQLFEMYQLVFGMGITWSRGQFNGGWEKLPNGERQRRVRGTETFTQASVRKLFVEAFSYSNTMLGHVSKLYRAAESGNTYAQGLVDAVDRGALSPQSASTQMLRPFNMTGNVLGLEEQRRLLDRGMTGLQAQVEALARLGFPVEVPVAELEDFLKAAYIARTQLSVLMNGVKKIIKKAKNVEGTDE